MRNLQEDLDTIEKATPGPWREAQLNSTKGLFGGKSVLSHLPVNRGWLKTYKAENYFVLTEAREGWPEAIRRAIKAESTLKEISEILSESDMGCDHFCTQLDQIRKLLGEEVKN